MYFELSKNFNNLLSMARFAHNCNFINLIIQMQVYLNQLKS